MLRNSSADERKDLYSRAYDELFQRIPLHPMLTPEPPSERNVRISKELLNLARFITKNSVYVEIGPGDCGVAFEVAKRVKQVFAIDVSAEITKNVAAPANFELILSDGSSIPVLPESVDVVYSNQLMEHLHPDDTLEQLRNIYSVLKPHGVYLCVTPNRLSGPHDVSRNYDAVATGLHLREYTITELRRIFHEIGFSRVKVFFRFSSINVLLPVFPYTIVEKLLGVLPHGIRRAITFNRAVRFLLGAKMVAVK